MSPFQSIKGKLLIFALCISLIPIAVITILAYFNTRSALKRQIIQDMTAVAESRRAHVLEFLETKKGRTVGFSSDGFIRDSLEKINLGEFPKHDNVIALNRHLSMNKMPLDIHIMAIAISNTAGRVVASTNEALIGKDISGLSYYSQAESKSYGEPYVDQPRHSPYLDAKVLCVSAPLVSKRGVESLGVIVNYYDLASLSEITANRTGLGETGEVYIVDRDGIMLTESRFLNGAPLRQKIYTEPISKITEGGVEMTGVYPNYMGVPVVGASTHLPEYRWTLLAEINKSEAFAQLKWLGIVALIVGIVSAAAVTSVGIIFATAVSRPIKRLTDATRRFAGWDFKARTEVTRRDEIGDLAKSFNAMAEELAEEITERKQAEERARQLAYYDPLTGLPNRVLYNDHLSLVLAHAQRVKEKLAVLFLDLDRFKDINDTLGHSVGDQLLRTIAERLTDSLRKEDTVTRQGGDEFTLLLPGMTQMEDAAWIAQKILEVVREPLTLSGHELNITTSIGIALYPDDGKEGETLLKNADTAMYHAKEQGRNNYQFFTPVLHTRTVEQLELESSLHHALERKEFTVYYQPQVNIETGQIVSSEALIRWLHPDRGIISPSEFIPLAERTGLIVPIGEWALRTACAQNRAWQDAGLPPLQVAVNLSSRQLQQEDMVEMVEKVLKETGLDAHFLSLEVTEGTAMRNVESTAYKMDRLNGLGVHFVIDDLGTGYSSLSYLKTFPIHALKIDKSFVQDIVIDSNDAAIVTAIISMAKGLRLKVVAEGVETVAQLEFLRALGCDEMQGYLCSKPVTAGEFKRVLEQNKRPRV